MIQDIFPHIYHNEYSPRPANGEDILMVITPDGILVGQNPDGTLRLPRCGDRDGQYLFSIDRTGYFLWEGESLPEIPGFSLLPSKKLRDFPPDANVFACAAAESLHRWYCQNRFCGCCGEKNAKSQTERAMVCPCCETTVYPKISPAVIVAVCHGDRLLLTKYSGGSFRMYALVAGFNEIGESIEDTVHREVLEETGLRVKNLRFYRSQPWVYTDSLLLGFFCDLDGDDAVTPQPEELSEASWHLRWELPTDHSEISLTGEMIEIFRRGEEPK